MRNMSFALTTEQIINESKTVTRRIGWDFLRSGHMIQACEKCQGLGKGGKIRKLKVIRVLSSRFVPLDQISESDVAKEGFPEKSPNDFVTMFSTNMKCPRDQIVNRIEFEYVKEGES